MNSGDMIELLESLLPFVRFAQANNVPNAAHYAELLDGMICNPALSSLPQEDDRELIERLRRAAQSASDIARQMAEDKSLRQAGHNPPRNDLYAWPKPEQTIEGRAADRLLQLSRDVDLLRDSLGHARGALEAITLTNDADWNCEDLREIARAALSSGISEQGEM
jgi:hypothetical protein